MAPNFLRLPSGNEVKLVPPFAEVIGSVDDIRTDEFPTAVRMYDGAIVTAAFEGEVHLLEIGGQGLVDGESQP